MTRSTALPVAAFGTTGHFSTRVIFGAAALGGMSQERADRDPRPGARLGHQPHRHRRGLRRVRGSPEAVAVRATATRCSSPPRPASEPVMGASRARTVADPDGRRPRRPDPAPQPRRAGRVGGRRRSGGAFEALERARDEGLVSNIGVTGHGIRIPGDAPAIDRAPRRGVGVVPRQLRPHGAARLPVRRRTPARACARAATDRVQTIKAIARGRWSDGTDRHFSWYEPLTDAGPIGRAGALRVVASADVPQHHERRPSAAARHRRGHRRPRTAVLDAELAADVAEQHITALFDNDRLERI